MSLLSQQGLAASQIADLLGYDPSTVRRHQRQGTPGLADRPRSGRPRLGSRRLRPRILRLLAQPRAWTMGRLWHAAGRPAISPRTLHRRTREGACRRRPRPVAKGDPDPDQVLADLNQQITDLPAGAVLPATTGRIVQWWLKPHPRLQVLHGARSSPHDNPTERVWGAPSRPGWPTTPP
jgi:hypothetical protein